MITLRPSGSYIWSNCAANPLFSSNAPAQEDSDASREGTAAAWVAECVLKGDAHSAEDLIDRNHKNGWLITAEICHYVQKYVDFLRSRGGDISAEQAVHICEYIEGTLDASCVSAVSEVMYVDDLKYGYDTVEVFENTQLILYAGGEYLRLGRPAHIKRVQMGIYQPRAFHHEGIYRHYSLSVDELMSELQRLINKGLECQAPNPVATPGLHCGYCPGAIGCEALAHSIYRLGFFVSKSSHFRELTDEEMSAELDAIHVMKRLLKARETALLPDAESRLKKGNRFIRGYFMKPRQGNRVFDKSPELIKAVTGFDPTDKQMVTPAELERRGAHPDAVAVVSKRPHLSSKLDRLPENHFRKNFGKVEE
jgi:hypothetical protein